MQINFQVKRRSCKKIILAAMLIISLPFTKAFSNSGPIYDESNSPIGYFSGDSITGAQGKVVGSLDNNVIYNSDNMPIGHIYSDGSITGPGQRSAGTLNNNIIYDPDNMPIGRIDSDGTTSTGNGSFVIKSPDPRVGAILLLHVLNLK